MNIVELLKSFESKTLEFKRDLSSPEKILCTLIAFANTSGGTLVIGVEDKTKHVLGVADPHNMQEKLANQISDGIFPQLAPEILISPWRDQYLLVVQVFPSQTKPHHLIKKGTEEGTYIRVGSSNRLADKAMIAELKRVKMDDPFDKQACSELSSEDLDCRAASDLFGNNKLLTISQIESLDLITTYQNKKVPTIAGIILFGKERLKTFPDAWIHSARFSGITKTTIRDTQEIRSYPILAIEEALDFVKKHSELGIEIQGARHTKKWNLPLTAIREALINSVVHADYSQRGSPIRLAIFDDRIEIENPGLLLFGLTIEEIKRGVSKLRNRVIGQLFHRLGLIEHWGSGIGRIINLCAEAGFAEPIFEEIGTHFRVTIFTRQITPPPIDEVDETILLALNTTEEGLSTKEIATIVEKSERAVRTRLITLIEKGKIVELTKSINDPKRKYFLKYFDTEIEDFINICKDYGYNPQKFKLVGHNKTEFNAGLYLLVGEISIIYNKTKRTYKTGNGTAWVIEFEKDLKKGIFKQNYISVD